MWHALVEALTVAKCEAEAHQYGEEGGTSVAGVGGPGDHGEVGSPSGDPVVGIVADYRQSRAAILGRALTRLRCTRPGDRINKMQPSMMFAGK